MEFICFVLWCAYAFKWNWEGEGERWIMCMCSMIAKAIVSQKRKFESNNSKTLGMSFVNIPSKWDSVRKTDGKSIRRGGERTYEVLFVHTYMRRTNTSYLFDVVEFENYVPLLCVYSLCWSFMKHPIKVGRFSSFLFGKCVHYETAIQNMYAILRVRVRECVYFLDHAPKISRI